MIGNRLKGLLIFSFHITKSVLQERHHLIILKKEVEIIILKSFERLGRRIDLRCSEMVNLSVRRNFLAILFFDLLDHYNTLVY